ncbi:MAG TPA: hypothetical protein PKD73_15070 [Burkholderiaceae bacterium]|jgi:hypothetical protein|nr:hypothetical protein [Burkholderiaceae bacterium]
MRSEVTVKDGETVYRFDLEEHQPIPHEAARRWLDEQILALDAEPLRASGKILTADKVVVVARAAGAERLRDPAWGEAFAAAASAALGKPVVRVDLDGLSIAY